MALTRVQVGGQASQDFVASMMWNAFDVMPTVGNGIIVLVYGYPYSGIGPYQVTDAYGNLYVRAAIRTNFHFAAVFHCARLTATSPGPLFYITVRGEGTSNWRAVALEVSGVGPYGLTVDQWVGASLSSNIIETGPTAPLTVDDTFQVAVFGQGATPPTIQVQEDIPNWLEVAETIGSSGTSGEANARSVPNCLGTQPLCTWVTSGGWGATAALLVAYKVSDVEILPVPTTFTPAVPSIKATASIPKGFGVAGLLPFAAETPTVSARPGLTAGGVPGALFAVPPLIRALATPRDLLPTIGTTPRVSITAPASIPKFKFVTPLMPFVKVTAPLVTLRGGTPPGPGAEWRKPIQGGTGHTIGNGVGDTHRVYLPPSGERAFGDLLVLAITWTGGTLPAPVIPNWTLAQEAGTPVVEGKPSMRTALYYKRYAADPSEFTIYGLGSGTTGSQSWVEAYRNGYTGSGALVLAASSTAATVPTVSWMTAYGEAPYYLPSLPITEPYALVIGVVGGRGSNYVTFGTQYRRTSVVTLDVDFAKMRYRHQYEYQGVTLNVFDGIKIIPGDTAEFGWTSGADSFAAVVVAFRSGDITPVPGHYYLAKKAPGSFLRGAPIAEWISSWNGPEYGAPHFRFTWELSPLGAGSNGLSSVFDSVTNQYPPSDVLFSRWCTPPLDAQTLGGTLTVVSTSAAAFVEDQGNLYASARWRIYAYVTLGESLAVRTTVIDRWMGATDLPPEYYSSAINGYLPSNVPTSGPIPLTPVTVLPGDRLILEIGYHVLSAPTPPIVRPPQYYESDWMHVGFGTGACAAWYWGEVYGTAPSTVPWVDAVAGTDQGYGGGGAPWLQFSQPLVELPKPPPPVNDHVTRAKVIASLPFTFGEDTTQSTDPSRGVWFRYTPTIDEDLLLHCFNGNYLTSLFAYQGASPETLVRLENFSSSFTPDAAWVEATTSFGFANNLQWAKLHKLKAGETYWLRFVNNSTWFNHSQSSGGWLNLTVSHYAPGPPEGDDLYVPSGVWLTRWRNNQLNDITDSWRAAQSGTITGIALDYSRCQVYDDWWDYDYDDPWPQLHTGERYDVGFHDETFSVCGDLVDWEHPVNTMQYCWWPGNVSLSNLVVDRAGLVLSGWFGMGYTRHGSEWEHNSGDPASTYLHTIALRGGPQTWNDADEAPVRRADPATHHDRPDWNYPNEAETFPVPYDKTGTNYIALAPDQTTLYYTSSAFYIPVEGGGQRIQRYDLNTRTVLPDFAVLPPHGSVPGVRGICCLADGGLLVCNGSQVDRLSADGTLTQSYVPTAAVYPYDRAMLTDIHITNDHLHFWVLDNGTHDLFLFALTGTQVSHLQTGLASRVIIQFAVYQPTYLEPPKPPCPVSPLWAEIEEEEES